MILVFHPVYRQGRPTVTVWERQKNLEGFVLGVIDAPDFVKSALITAKVENFSVRMYEEGPRGMAKLLYAGEAAQDKADGSGSGPPASVSSPPGQISALQVADRTWRVVFEPKASFYEQHRTTQVWLIFAASLFITLLISVSMLRMALRNARINALAGELSQTNQELQAKILDQERAENALRESEKKIRQMQKMEAVGQRLAGLLMTSTTSSWSSLGSATCCFVKLAANSALCEHVRTIKTAALRAGDLTRQLLAFSRKQLLQPRVADLNELIRNGESMLRRMRCSRTGWSFSRNR